jgi:hypothetical protein
MGACSRLASRPDPQHLKRLYYQLTQIEAAGTFTKPVHYKELFTGAAVKRTVGFCYRYVPAGWRDQQTARFVSRTETRGNCISIDGAKTSSIWILKDSPHLEDLETGETIQINAQQAKAYKETLAAAPGRYPYGITW